MRLLQLMTRADEVLDLHPRVSVVQGLRPEDRHLLIRTVRGMVQPEPEPIGTGLLEAHGVLFDLRPEHISMLDVRGEGVDPVVRRDDLPTQPLTVDGRELRAKERAFAAIIDAVAEKAEVETAARAAVQEAAAALTRARSEKSHAESAISERLTRVDALAADLDRLEADLARARDEHAKRTADAGEADERLAEVDGRTGADRAEVETARLLLGSARAALEEALGASDEDAPAEVEAALRRQDEVAAQLLEVRDRLGARSTTGGDVDELEGAGDDVAAGDLTASLEQELVVLEDVPTDGVEAALAELRRNGAGSGPSSDAHQLADEVEQLLVQLEDEAEPVDPERVERARARLDAAREALMVAEEAVRSPHRDSAGVARIEAAHEALLEAIDRSEGRFAPARSKVKVDELREREHEALGALGFHSYTDYIMGNSSLTADDEARSALESARRELGDAENEWADIERQTEESLARAVVHDRRRDLLRRAEALVGSPVARLADAPEVLRQVTVLPEGVVEALAALRSCLTAVGFDVEDDDLEREDLVVLAEAFLAEAREVAGRRAWLEQRLAALRAGEPDPGPTATGDGNDVSDGDAGAHAVDEVTRLEAELAAADADLAEARARLAAHGVAEEERRRLAADVAEAEQLVAAAEASTWSAEQEFRAAQQQSSQAHEEADATSQAVAAAEAALVAARQELADLEAQSRVGLDQFTTAVAEAESAHFDARSRLESATNELAALSSEGQAMATAIERLQDIVAAGDVGEATPAEELEWYLLARLASQRAVSIGGSLPVVLDDALAGLDDEDVLHILERLEPMAEAMQLIVLSEDPVVSQWALDAGPSRAAVVQPGPA